VRFEAIVSMTRHSGDARLTQALIEVLQAPDPALANMAAWALARYGNASSRSALRKALRTTPYRSVQIQVCRALASMNDRGIVPWLKEHIENPDWGVRIAAASGLGKLKAFDAVPQLLQVLYASPHQSHKEAALALARLLGAEVPYIQLTRTLAEDAATGLAQQMDTLRTRLQRSAPNTEEVEKYLAQARDLFARQMWEAAFGPFLEAARLTAAGKMPVMCQQMLTECATRIHEFGRERLEYVVLAILVMERCGK
jgi:HEAT repeat protein